MARIILASLLFLAFSASATAAGSRNTPPAFAGAGSQIECIAQNLDTTERTVTASLVHYEGTLFLGPNSLPVPPGTVKPMAHAGGGPLLYCQFEGLTRKVRGWLMVYDAGGTRTMLPAAK